MLCEMTDVWSKKENVFVPIPNPSMSYTFRLKAYDGGGGGLLHSDGQR